MTNENYTGVTTGTVATACSLAALDAILDTSDIACVKVETPKKTLDIIIDECKKLSDNKAYAVAHKNSYHDPDVTVGLAIISTVELFDKTDEESNVIITGGEGVGKGYYNMPEKTKESFLTINGIPYYRSGDYAIELPNGEIDIKGRIDNQIKLRGLRIEIGEIPVQPTKSFIAGLPCDGLPLFTNSGA